MRTTTTMMMKKKKKKTATMATSLPPCALDTAAGSGCPLDWSAGASRGVGAEERRCCCSGVPGWAWRGAGGADGNVAGKLGRRVLGHDACAGGTSASRPGSAARGSRSRAGGRRAHTERPRGGDSVEGREMRDDHDMIMMMP